MCKGMGSKKKGEIEVSYATGVLHYKLTLIILPVIHASGSHMMHAFLNEKCRQVYIVPFCV
jgi:hypothetical protein